MNINIIGINHKTAPVELREKFAFSDAKATQCLKSVQEQRFANEAIILSTCNRVEFYQVSEQEDSYDVLSKFLSQFHNIQLSEFEKSLYFYKGNDAVRHLFRVASGLDSMVVGESEILGQMKKSYTLAGTLKTTGPILNTLFQRAFYVAKLLKTTTKIHEGSLSVSSVAVQLAEKIFGDLSSTVALLIGAGEISELTVQRLVSRGVKRIIASNRSFDKAQSMAERFCGKAVHFDEILSVANEVDIIISSTSAPHVILKKDDVARLMSERRQRALFIIDIAVPRDVDPEVNTLDSVYLYNIDDLTGMSEKNLQERLAECEKAEKIVEEETQRFMDGYHVMGLRPTLQKLQNSMEKIRLQELDKTKNYLKNLNDEQWVQVDFLTQRIIKGILHRPFMHLKDKTNGNSGSEHEQFLRDLFGLEDRSE